MGPTDSLTVLKCILDF